jgi:hypothetical protein
MADENGGGAPAPAAPAPENQPAPAAPAADELPGGLPADDPNGEGTTPEEVAATLKSAGINLPVETPAAAAEGEEEGDDPDAPAGGEEPAAPAAPAEEPAAPAEDEDDGKPAPTDEEVQAAADARAAAADDKYSLTVEDANGVSFKIPVGATMEDILAEFEPKNNGQILDILSQLQDLKVQKANDDKAEAEQTAKTEQAQRVSEIRKGWESEVTDLTAQKRIPDGEDGKARVNEVYKFMSEENDKRMAAGKPTIGSFEDALDKLEAKEGRDKAAEAAKAAKTDARAKGSLVGGSSAAATSAPKPYRAGSARNANEAIRSMGLLN